MILLETESRPVIAHRGNRAHAPENTIVAFRQAVEAGADAIELDVHVTLDGHAVVIHDSTLDRTTDGVGAVASRTLDELRRVDAGSRFSNDHGRTFPYKNQGIGIPTLEEVIESLPHDFPLLIELKTPNATGPLRQIIESRGIANRAVVAGFASKTIHPLRSSDIPLGATRSDAIELLWTALSGRRAVAPKYDALCIPPRWNGLPVPVLAMVRALRGTRKVVHVWTINEPAAAQRLWRGGVQGIVTDDPELLVAARLGA